MIGISGRVLPTILPRKPQIISAFHAIYVLCLFVLILGSWLILSEHPASLYLGEWAARAGVVAMGLFIISTIPGIARRFRITHPLTIVLMAFRRQIGTLSAILVIVHAAWLLWVPAMKYGVPATVPPFVILGVLAAYPLFALLATSNDWAVRKLGRYWHWLHRAVYVIYWLVFGHVALQSSRWAILVGLFAVLEVFSLLYAWKNSRPAVAKAASIAQPQPQV